jgi:hypothetical protein
MRKNIMTAAVVLASGLPLALPAAAADNNPGAGTRLLQEEAYTGSRIRRELAHSNTLPLNKRYEQFTPEEKAALAAEYESMGEGDEPPFPRDGLEPILRAIEKANRRIGASGQMALLVEVNAQGRAVSVSSLTKFADPQMLRFVAEVLMLTSYKPALCKGLPCRMEFPFRASFRIE